MCLYSTLNVYLSSLMQKKLQRVPRGILSGKNQRTNKQKRMQYEQYGGENGMNQLQNKKEICYFSKKDNENPWELNKNM